MVILEYTQNHRERKMSKSFSYMTPGPTQSEIINFSLPICPKCNETKSVSDISGQSNGLIDHFRYKCTNCKISWNQRKIIND